MFITFSEPAIIGIISLSLLFPSSDDFNGLTLTVALSSSINPRIIALEKNTNASQ